jgi:acetate kinase
MQVLVLNAGSTSLKYQLIDTVTGRSAIDGTIERLGTTHTHADAIAQLIATLADHPVDAVGHRVVHGGDDLRDATLIDDAVCATIDRHAALAPLHNPPQLAAIRAARAAFPAIPHVAVFDTALFAGLPRRARTYAIDTAIAEAHGLRRYGFHGTSHGWVAELAARALKRPLNELRLVTLHLGGGASAAAIEFGHATETSMGMTPLEGLVMGTRAGDIDPGVVLALLERGFDAAAVADILGRRGGLAGLSGRGADLRDIETAAEAGDDRCRLAVQVFAHRVRKYIGAYAATMGGLDAVVLTAGIGENAVAMRRRILQRLDFLGLVLDDEKNAAAKVSDASPTAIISTDESRVKAIVARTDEEMAIARHTAAIVSAASAASAEATPTIPIAVSARHIHLDAATFAALFGPDATPTHLRDISQPGQFACAETVNLIGPRGRIDKVRLLGPLRPRNQIEVSRTDEFRLGVDAPIRDSGKTVGSAPITVEGPHGTVQLAEGLICAKRHIHMHPRDAAIFGVADGDEVEVAITGGPRDLVFGDVLVRVSEKFVLEMHIDTDEANAAELDQGASGALVYTPGGPATATLRGRRQRDLTHPGT